MALSAGMRLGPYEVLGPIGAGGVGEVYRAKDTRLDRTVAIKILPAEVSRNPDRRARFERSGVAESTRPAEISIVTNGFEELKANVPGE